MNIWDLQTYKWHLKPWEWIYYSLRERIQIVEERAQDGALRNFSI